MRVRPAVLSDCDNIVDLFIQLNQETSFLAFETGECEAQRKSIHAMMEGNIRQDQSLVLVVEETPRVVGLLMATGSLMLRRRGSVHLVIGILEEFKGRGMGTALMQGLQEWALAKQLHRLELTVMTHNQRAVALYKKSGFQIEGTKRDSLLLDGRFVDEYYMSKLLPCEGNA